MNAQQLLKYGFVVFLNNEAIYDHKVRAKLPYANALKERLKSPRCPVIAHRYYPADTKGVSSPLFRFVSARSGIASYQSAYYLSDALTRKGVLPVYIHETGEVKDLMPLLEEEDKTDANIAIQIVRARYIQADKRKPTAGFMVQNLESEIDASTIQLDDADMMKIFGRLPADSAEQDKVVQFQQAEVEPAFGRRLSLRKNDKVYLA